MSKLSLSIQLKYIDGSIAAARLRGVDSVSYTRILGEVGDIQVDVSAASLPVSGTDLIDMIIEPYLSVTIDGRVQTFRDGIFYIKKAATRVDESGALITTLTGYDENVLLRNRVIAYRKETAQTVMSGAADDLIIDIYNDQLGSDSNTDYDGVSTSGRELSNYVGGTSGGNGPTLYVSGIEEQNLLDVLQDIQAASAAEGNETFFGFRNATFEVKTGVWGSDRVRTSVFSRDRGNLTDGEIVIDASNAVTHCYSTSSHSGVGEKEIQVVTSAIAVRNNATRKEAFATIGSVDQDGSDLSNQIESGGRAYLARNRYTIQYDAEIKSTPQNPYGPSGWGLGDKVTCYAVPGEEPIFPIVRGIQVDLSASGSVTIIAKVGSLELVTE